ncbi:15901_t:CDS:2, partial [Gigaspora rosea]
KEKHTRIKGANIPKLIKKLRKRKITSFPGKWKEIETYAESHYRPWRINQKQRNYLLKETARLFRKRIATKKRINSLISTQRKETKSQAIKRNLRTKKLKKRKCAIGKTPEVERISQKLYYASPRKLRYRFLTLTEDKAQVLVWEKFTIIFGEMLRQTTTEGEKVLDPEIVINKYGRPILQSGQVIQLEGDRPKRKHVDELRTIMMYGDFHFGAVVGACKHRIGASA